MIFWTKFAQAGNFRPKTKKSEYKHWFYIFKLVLVPNFNLNWQFWFFWPNLPKKGISSRKWKITIARVSIVVTYIKPFHTGANRHNGNLISPHFLVGETIIISFDLNQTFLWWHDILLFKSIICWSMLEKTLYIKMY